MAKPIECYLQTSVGGFGCRNGETVLKDCLWWEIVEIERLPYGGYRNNANVLLKFKSKSDRKLFKYVYCEGNKQQSTMTLRVKISKWKDVPYCKMNLSKIYVTEKVEELLKKQYPGWEENKENNNVNVN